LRAVLRDKWYTATGIPISLFALLAGLVTGEWGIAALGVIGLVLGLWVLGTAYLRTRG